MKNALLILMFPIFIMGASMLAWNHSALNNYQPAGLTFAGENTTISCSPLSQRAIDTLNNGKFIIALPGWGSYSYHISTNNDSAQFYFNQGLTMYYSYHQKEAEASFKEAARFDPASPMVYWGQALSIGPGYNSAHLYKKPEYAPEVIQLMNQNIGSASEKEKQLIEAMNRRYPADTSDTQRAAFNSDYAGALYELVTLYPGDQDIKALYIDAVMLIHPWNFWNNDGSPKAWTPELVKLCEFILKQNARHPAALHYYIHITEASRHPEVALPGADLLKDLLPGVAHMVHMSSHEYERNGLFAKGVEANDKADAALLRYDSLAKNLSLNKHIPHYFAVRAYCALSGAMYTTGMNDALSCRNSVAPVYEKTYDQYLYMMPVLTQVRMGKWKEILKDRQEPDTHWSYASLLNDFARGMASVYTGHNDSATRYLLQLKGKSKDPILENRRIPFNKPSQGALIAEKILNSAILFSQKKYDLAIVSLKAAIRAEDSLVYTEPKDWLIPARQFLGAYLLKMGKPVAAEKVYREDLIWNPGNGWSYLGLCQSLKAQHKTKNLSAYRAKYLQAFSNAEQIPPGSVFIK